MRIAFVVHDFRRIEGHSRYVVELATRFAREHEVHVFANRIEPVRDSTIQFHHVPAWRASALLGILTFAAQATIKVRGHFDIIHNQGLCGLRGNVFTAHICNRAWHEALRAAAGKLSFREWVSGNTLSALEHLFYGNTAEHVIAVSQLVASDIRRHYHSRSPISVIHHGVDLNTFCQARRDALRIPARAECGVIDEEMAFLFVGDLRKGALHCMRALATVGTGKLLLVSRSSDAPYRALASQLGISDRVHFAGATTQVEKYYAAADVLLLPTHYDSFGMVVTEAMASGVAVIVSRQAGVAELIQSGTNGLLLDDYADTAELADAMALLASDPPFARRLGSAACASVQEYSWDVVAARTMQVYTGLFKQKTTVEVHPASL